MRRVIIKVIFAFAVVALVSTPAAADDRSAVAVRFVVADRDYKAQFGADLPGIETALAERIVPHLQGRIGFVRFTAQGGPDTVLTFELNRQDPKNMSALGEIGFHITLRRKDALLGENVYVAFRSQTETFKQVLGREALLEAVGPKVAAAAGPRGPITALLSAVPITRTAVFMRSPLGWAIPYRHDDLCMDRKSRVRLLTTINSPAASVEHEFTARTAGALNDGVPRGRILGVPDPESQAHLDELRNAPPEQVRVETFYVVEYSPKTPCDAVVVPR